MSKTDYSTPLEQSYIYTAGLQDKNFQFQNNLDIVVNLCNTFNSILYQNYGSWYFIKPKDLAFGVNEASKFSQSGTLNTSSKQAIPTLRHGTDFLIIAEPKRKVRRFYKQQQVVYQRGSSKFINGNFNLWDGTQNEISYTDTLDLFASGLTETNFTYFTKSFLGTPKTYSLYDSVANDYLLGLSASASTGCIFANLPVSANWGEGFSLGISSPTANPSFSVTISIPFGLTSKIWYFDFNDEIWRDYEVVYTPADTTSFNYDFQFPDVLDAELIKYPDYKIGIKLYASTRPGYSGLQTIYDRILVNANGNYFYGTNGATPIPLIKQSQSNKDSYTLTNPKKSTITPDPLTVYFGSNITTGDIYLQDWNYSDIFTYYDSALTSTGKGWFERNEYDPAHPENGGIYDINELNARNILNQYSDYRNIFTGTIIGKNLQYGAIYEFPIQGALAERKFFPLSMKFNERDCTADVVLLELSSGEIDAEMVIDRYDAYGNLISSQSSESKKKIVTG
jgi:hypothetical protein